MADREAQISGLAELMAEYGLSEAKLTLGDLTVGYKKRLSRPGPALELEQESSDAHDFVAAEPEADPEALAGTKITSPMTGIFYSSPSPSAPAFVKEGVEIEAGQIIGLIEAMKVFSEIPAPVSGTVSKVLAFNGQLVQVGDVLLLLA